MTRSSKKISRTIKLAKHTIRIKRADGGETDPMLDSDVKNTENPYKNQVLKPYDPTVRDRLASSILDLVPRGEHTPEALKQFVSNTLGSLGAGHKGLSLVDLTPVGGAMGAQEAAREGDYKGAAMAMLPGAPALRAESRALKVAEKYGPHLPSIEVRAPDPYVKGVNDPKPELQQAIKDFYAGKLTREDYDNFVRRVAPVEPYDFIPQPSPEHLAVDALNAAKKDKYAMNRDIYQEGDPVSLRLDIPAYTNLPNSQWVNSIHDTRGVHPTTYDSVSAARNVDFVVPETKARMTGEGGPKAPYAVMRGEYLPINADDAVAKAREIMEGPLPSQWQQVGMDPRRHSYFYTRDERMIPVTNADEVLQIGPVVYAKNPKTGQREDFGYAEGGRVGFADGGAPWDVDLSANPFEYKPSQGSDVPLANMDLYKGAALNTVPEILPEKKVGDDSTAGTSSGADTTYYPEGSGGGGGGDWGANGPTTTSTTPGTNLSQPSAPSPSPDVAPSTTTGIGDFISGKISNAVNNPLATVVNAAVGFVPGFGLVNTLSGVLGGPTVGTTLSPNKSAPAAPEKVAPSKMSMTQADDTTSTTSGPGTFGGGLNTSISDATGLTSEGAGAGGGGLGGAGGPGGAGAGTGNSGGAGAGGTGGAGVGSGAGAGVGETGGPGGPSGGDRGGGDNSGGGSGSGSGGSGSSGGAGGSGGTGGGSSEGSSSGEGSSGGTGDGSSEGSGSGAGGGGAGGGTGGGSSEGSSAGEGSSGGTGDGTGEGSGSGQGGNGDGAAGVKRGGAITLHRYHKSKGPIDLTGRNDRATKRVATKKSVPPNALINKALGVVSKKT